MADKIESVKIENFGPISSLNWQNIGSINLVIGANGCGKTFLLKALYSAIKTLELYKRGNDTTDISRVLRDKLYWTFQAENIGSLVSKGKEHLHYEMCINERIFSYEFGKDATDTVSVIVNQANGRYDTNSVFLPAKEVLSIQHIILLTRDVMKWYGFDDTSYDLATALSIPPSGDKSFTSFTESKNRLSELLQGSLFYDEKAKVWVFKNKNNQSFQMGTTSEGIKKLGILDTLLSNHFINNKSIIFVDEPESGLHPAAISEFLEIINILSDNGSGIQFFIASHSYFVIQKLFNMAQRDGISIPVLSFGRACLNVKPDIYDLKDGMPDNPIINESINLYNEEIEISLK